MSNVNSYDLYLPNITRVVSWAFPDKFPQYVNMLCAQLHKQGKILTLDEVIALTGKSNKEEVATAFPFRFVRAIHETDTSQKYYFDLEMELIVTPQNSYDLYERLFCYVINYLDYSDIHPFLSYQFEKGFEKNLERYIDFLVPQTQIYEGSLLDNTHLKLISSWVEITKHKIPEAAVKTKGKPPRNPEDQRTVLTLDQTALLIHHLRDQRVFDRDEYLTNKSAGIAFEILTGYSADAIRVKLGDLGKLSTEKNLKNIQLVLTRLIGQIKIDLGKMNRT